MTIVVILCIISTLPFTLVRLLRWLAWSQQKEYRSDRVWSFLLSPEGSSELLRLIPQKKDFSRTGLKRPVITIRSILVFFISLVLLGFIFATSLNLGWWWLPFLIYIFIPLLPVISSFVTEIIKLLISLVLLFIAQKKVNKHQPKIVGVTGSYGKTATRHLATSVLAQQYTVYTPPKSHNTPLSIALDLIKNYQNQDILFLEFAAYKQGEIKKLAHWFKPDITIITGLTAQHLALFGSLENIVRAKGELVKATKIDGKVLYNQMDPGTEKICAEDQSKQHQPYSPQLQQTLLSQEKLDHKARLSVYWGEDKLNTNLIGLHHTETIAAAISLGLILNIPKQKIITGIKSFVPENVFTQAYFHPTTQTLIINDGKTTNPKGFRSALAILNHFKKQGKNTILITGGVVDLGDETESIHLDLARTAKPIVDLVFYTGSDGKAAFKEVFEQRMTDHLPTLVSLIPKFNQDDVILIEGHIPLELTKLLKRKND
ncbi:MAG: Mur ligase family protein [Patescibacteria group bacterium]